MSSAHMTCPKDPSVRAKAKKAFRRAVRIALHTQRWPTEYRKIIMTCSKGSSTYNFGKFMRMKFVETVSAHNAHKFFYVFGTYDLGDTKKYRVPAGVKLVEAQRGQSYITEKHPETIAAWKKTEY